MPKMACGIAFAGLLRYLSHFLSGWLFFGEWAEEGFNAFTWAVVYNGAYMIPDTVIGRKALTRLRVVKGAEHAHAAQKPEVWEF